MGNNSSNKQSPKQEKEEKPVKKVELENDLYIIWIDPRVDEEENILYRNELNVSDKIKIKCFNNVKEAIKFVKTIQFEETVIITSGSLYNEFINKFRENLIDIYIVPKIIIFTSVPSKQKYFSEIDNSNTSFYNYGGVQAKFDDVKDFIFKKINDKANNENNEGNSFSNKDSLKFNENKKRNLEEEGQLTFERIDCIEKLVLPLYYKSLIELSPDDNIEKYTEYIYNEYSSNDDIKKLFKDIKSIRDIPKELLSKYYARLYTFESAFYRNLNKELRENKKAKYLQYIKILYEGVKLKALPLASNKILYRGSVISNDELDKIKAYLNDKTEDLPGAIVFSRSFLSFSEDINVAKTFSNNVKDNFSRVLYIIEKDYDFDYSLSTHSDMQNVSKFSTEKEVLFFPFSSFEIKEIKGTMENNGIIYQIKLLYLGKYQEKIKNVDSEIPESDFKTQMEEIGLIPQEKMEKSKEVIEQYQVYKEKVDEIKMENDEITLKYNAKDKKEIMIFGNTFVSNNLGKCKIVFKKKEYNLMQFFTISEFTNEKLTELEIKLRYINNITDMSFMFHKCTRLLSISNLDKLCLENTTNISYMFSECESLSSLSGLNE